MTINGISGANTQTAQMGMNQAMDSYSKNIQNQIANAQKQLQELSSNEGMTLEEKMKKRQEIQQQISDLNMQLRQHQIEQRRAQRFVGCGYRNAKKFLTEVPIGVSIFHRKGVTVKQRFALVNVAYQKSNLTLAGAVAFLMSFIFFGLPDIDDCDDDADDRHYNTGKVQNHFEHQ